MYYKFIASSKENISITMNHNGQIIAALDGFGNPPFATIQALTDSVFPADKKIIGLIKRVDTKSLSATEIRMYDLVMERYAKAQN